jgi:hypothetical protein
MAEKSGKNKTKYYFVLGVIVISALLWGGCRTCRYVAEGEYTGTVQRADITKVDGEYRVEFLVDEEIYVFKNADSTMYLKRNSADVQAKLGRYAENKKTITVTTWGWRSTWFSWFPNIVRIKE